MKAVTWILVGILAFVGYEAYELAMGTGTLQFIFQGVNFNGLTNWTVNITVQNVSNATVTINSMTGNVLINGNQLASISSFTPTTVPANGQINIPVTVQPSLLSIPGDVQQLIQTPGSNFDFSVQGNANVSGFILPFTLDKMITV